MKKESIAFVISFKSWYTRMDFPRGYGNGYVALPAGHPMYGKDYDDINVDVYCGLTRASNVEDFAHFHLVGDYWIVGFDTAHFGDDETNRPKEKVIKETLKLKEQLDAMR